ncbi:aspartic peptidase domain-containing protein [Globomyces pollinis-pini]|nr:aspartic peptidase domain-containing protein [Globomyces pollinis-pini]
MIGLNLLSVLACVTAIKLPLYKRTFQTGHHRDLYKRDGDKAALFNSNDIYFVMPITVDGGLEENGVVINKTVELVVDSGTADLWVTGQNCISPKNDKSCQGKSISPSELHLTPVNYSNTNTAISATVAYGTASAKVSAYSASISFGPDKAKKNLIIGVSDEEVGTEFIDGVLGLGFSDASSLNLKLEKDEDRDKTNFLDALFGDTLFDSSFGLYFSKNLAEGEISFGDINPERALVRNSHSVKLLSFARWDFDVSNWFITVGSLSPDDSPLVPESRLAETLPDNSVIDKAILDIGTSVIFLPPGIAAKVNTALKATYDKSTRRYLLNCDDQTLTNVAITDKTTNFTFILTRKFYVLKDKTTGTCYSGFAPTTSKEYMIFGTVFLRSYYTYWNKTLRTISFAPAVHDKVKNVELIQREIEQLMYKIQAQRLQLQFIGTAEKETVERSIDQDLKLLKELQASVPTA